jgi:hypothetical protein
MGTGLKLIGSLVFVPFLAQQNELSHHPESEKRTD